MKATVYRLALSWPAVGECFEARPELGPGGPFRLERHSRRLVICYARKRPPYDVYELFPQDLWIEGLDRGRQLEVQARVVSRASPRGFMEATVFALSGFGANLINDLADLRSTRERRRDERKALLDLAAATLSPLEVGEERGPFRD